MLGKRSRPSVRRLPEIITPTDRAASSDIMLSPPTGSRIISPNGWKNPDLGGVGLAIVAALDKPSSDNSEIKAKFFVGSLNLSRSDPIPIGSVKNRVRFRGGFDESECSENFTFVTSRLSDKATSTRVYYGASERGGEFHHRGGEFDSRFRKMGMFFASPPTSSEPFPALPTADFLSSCYLCRKKLHGKDIYMYRGEKAFCSTECRSRQIVSDERKEKCGSEASKSSDYSIYSESRFLSPGVVAA